MSVLSSNTLFHFTSLRNLLGILENEFCPRYSIEQYYENDKEAYRIGIPMVCFCDIPLAQVEEHMKAYGQYGIGMTKKWAKTNRLNPVLYLESHSLLLKQLHVVLQRNYVGLKAGMHSKTDKVALEHDRHSLLNIFMHTKPFDGYHERNGSREHKKFYDEREWRYIPSINRLEGDQLLLDLSNVKIDKGRLSRKNDLLKGYKLSFEPDDIEYLIIINPASK